MNQPNNVPISVAMATYNGERYLEEQLDSLSKQTFSPCELVVCDDNSQDSTIDILQSYSKSASFSVRVYRNEKNLGYASNFLKAANLCLGDWVAFCDQDDVWLPNKLLQASQEISRNSNLCLVLQNAIVTDQQCVTRKHTIPDSVNPGTYPANSQYGFWVWLGFLQTFRRSILDDFDSSIRPRNYFPGHKVQSHDKWTCMIANALGEIAVLKDPVALYRRHESALTGNYEKKSPAEKFYKAKDVKAEHYRFLSEVANDTERVLRELAHACSDSGKQDSLTANANEFTHIENIQHLRFELYRSSLLAHRISRFLSIARRGGYVGPATRAMGTRSLAKDLLRVFKCL